MRSLSGLALLAGLAFLATPALAQEKETEKRLFWHVTSDKGEVYLLGSIHVGTEDMYPLPKEIEEAYEKSSALAVEADIEASDPVALQRTIMEKGMYAEGDSLSKHISKDNLKKVKEYCKANGPDFGMVKGMKPWLAAVQIEGMAFQKLGLNPQLGIDKHFLVAAHKKKKKIVELESIDAQLGLLAGFSDELQETFLLSTVAQQEKGKKQLEALLDAWKTGDADKVDAISRDGEKEHPEFQPVADKMIYDRNVTMTKKIEELLAEGGTSFVTVGSAHMVGEKGIVKALEKTKKYKLERPALSKPEKKAAPEKKPEPKKSGDDE
jgi:uncharacterized protein YbaP (TraB family)